MIGSLFISRITDTKLFLNIVSATKPKPLVTSCRFLPEIQARPSVVDHLCSSPVASLSWVMYTRVLEVDLDMSP